MPSEMTMSAATFLLSTVVVVLVLFRFPRRKQIAPWLRVVLILSATSGILQSATSLLGIVGAARKLVITVAFALAIASVVYLLFAKRVKA
jgi:hypothetical protein